MAENPWMSEMLLTMPSKPEYTGEPDALKGARPVRRGAVGKVPQGNSLAAYFIL